MATQKSIIKLKGTIGDISFYKTQDGHLAREKGGVDGERIKNDPSFIRTRENNKEFGSAAGSSKLLRRALSSLMHNASDNRIVARVTKLMSDIRNLDGTSDRGQRNVGDALLVPQTLQMFKNFNFNQDAELRTILQSAFSAQTNGTITISSLVPQSQIRYPLGATHVTFKPAWLRIDFVSGTYELLTGPDDTVALDNNAANLIMQIGGTPTMTGGVNLFLLRMEFFQQINFKQYALKNGTYNSLAIVEVL
jgi:hypothetical protein